MSWIVKPSTLKGTLSLPPSKSHTVRALLFALMCDGECVINRPLISPDFHMLIKVCEELGAKIELSNESVTVRGCGGNFHPVESSLDLGNSGIALRFLTALLSLSHYPYFLKGDASLSQREMLPLFEALGVQHHGVHAPFLIQGPFKKESLTVLARDSQYLSACLMMAPFAQSDVSIIPRELKERPYIEITLQWLSRLGLNYKRSGDLFTIPGKQKLSPFHVTIPADFSTLLFPLVGTLISKGEVRFPYLDFEDAQGDRLLIPVLQKRGADLSFHKGVLTARGGKMLKGGALSIEDQIDALPILALLGCFCSDPLTLTEIEGARHKECDRPQAVMNELQKMGMKAELTQSTMTIFPSKLRGCAVYSHGDHRIALMLAMAGAVAEGTTHIQDVECAAKTFPHFASVMKEIDLCICS